jgi:hypothetical protein
MGSPVGASSHFHAPFGPEVRQAIQNISTARQNTYDIEIKLTIKLYINQLKVYYLYNYNNIAAVSENGRFCQTKLNH